jgi:hypothetical protein
VERRYSSYSFTTSALDGGEWSASRPGRALPPEKGPPLPIVQEAGWAPEPVWTQRVEVDTRSPLHSPLVPSSEDDSVAYCYDIVGRRSSVSIESGWTTVRLRFDLRQRQRIFPLPSVSRPALRPTQLPLQWVPVVLSPGVKSGQV